MKEKITAALKAAGLEPTEKVVADIKKVLDEEINGQFIPKSKFDEVNEKLKVEKEAKDLAIKQADTLKGFQGTNEELSAQLKKQKEEMAKLEKESAAKIETFKKTTAVKLQLMKDKALDADLAMKVLDLSKIELDDSDKIVGGYQDQLAGLKKEKAFLFQKETNPNGGKPSWFNKGNKPESGSGGNPDDGELTPDKEIIQEVIKQGKESHAQRSAGPDFFFGGKPQPNIEPKK